MLAEDTSRLIKIDELYALRLDRYISLPQLVVVGDQSSGKSSVLEGLTGLPFPRDAGLCTRFPTQIVFKRSKEHKVDISIIHSPTDGKAQSPVPLFETTYLEDFSQMQFLEVLDKAGRLMGATSQDGAGGSFSNDMLKVELSGPSHEHFSVVDLPGIFRKPTPGQTTKEDMNLVRQMIHKYIRNPRSIILAVVPANVDIATQEIIQMAEDADPKRERTLGVLTKPDLVDKGAEDKVIGLIIGTKGHSNLGYTVVCNRSQSDLEAPLSQRNAKEALFFDSIPWSSLAKERTGITALKRRLDKLLVDVTRQNFKAVVADVQQRIRTCEKLLEHMGTARQSADEQRTYLTRVASTFQTIAMKAVDGYYSRDGCFKKSEYRLATFITELNEAFSQEVFSEGSSYRFGCSNDKSENLGEPSCSARTRSSGSQEVILEYPELESILSFDKEDEAEDREDIIMWITREHNSFKGFEVGTVNPSLLPTLFSEQSRPWKRLALAHAEACIRRLHHFIHELLGYVCEDMQIVQSLWEKLIPRLLDCYQRSLDQVRFLAQAECNGKLITMNHYFADNLRKRRLDRVEKRLEKLQSWVTNDTDKEPLLRLRDTLDVFVSNEDQTIHDIHDILESYYKVARKRFVDAICLQAIDYHLISAEVGPLSTF